MFKTLLSRLGGYLSQQKGLNMAFSDKCDSSYQFIYLLIESIVHSFDNIGAPVEPQIICF